MAPDMMSDVDLRRCFCGGAGVHSGILKRVVMAQTHEASYKKEGRLGQTESPRTEWRVVHQLTYLDTSWTFEHV